MNSADAISVNDLYDYIDYEPEPDDDNADTAAQRADEDMTDENHQID